MPRLAAFGIVLALAAPLPVAAATATPGPSSSSPAPVPSTPTGTATGAGTELPISVTMRGLTPIAPQPGDVLRIAATLHNESSGVVSDLQVQLRYRPSRIGSRSEFDDYAIGSRTGPAGSYSPLPLPPVVANGVTVTPALHSLAPGASAAVTVSVPVDALQLDRPWQVYEIGLQVNGSTTVGFDAVGGLRTFLPWAPVNTPGVGATTQLAWVWPLADRPHRTVGDIWADDDLARAIGAGGRLADLLGAGIAAEDQQPVRPAQQRRKGKRTPPRPVVPVTPVPVTWAIDPLLVEDVASMADGYKVGTGRSARSGTGTDEAKAWLAALRTATAKTETLALPYADPDVVAAARGGLGGEVQVAINSGTTLLSRVLGSTPLAYAWPPSGLVDQRTLDTLFAAGVSTVVLDGSALPPADPPSVTPGAHSTVRGRDGNLDALLTDSGLTTVIGIGAEEPDKAPLALQRFLAETLMIQAELPSRQRTLVVAPDRRWTPTPAYAAALVADSGKVPWLTPVPLSAALSAPQDGDVTRLPLNYPTAARRAELPRSYVGEVLATKRLADVFAAVLPTAGDPHAREFDDAVLRALSSAWRGQKDPAARFRQVVDEQLKATKARVHIASLPGSFVTLTSHSGTVPVTVANELDTPVRVIVAISSQHLTVSGSGRTAQTIPPHRQIAVDVRAEARTSGVFPLTVRLLTPGGQVYDSEDLYVRSTAYGSVAILITAGATGVLLLAVAIRLVRRGLAARRPAVAP